MFKNFLRRAKQRFQPDKSLIADTYLVQGESCLTKNYKDNLQRLKNIFEGCMDIIFRELQIEMDETIDATLIYLDGMVDRVTLHNNILRSLMTNVEKADYPKDLSPLKRLDRIKNIDLLVGEVKDENDMYLLVNAVLSGDVIFLLDGSEKALIINGRGWTARGVEKTDTENVIRGPRESFSETLRVNTALIRRRIKDPNLKLKMIKLGKKSNTDIAIMYIQGIARDDIIKEVEKRLETVNLDHVMESGYIESFIEDDPYSPFPQVMITERPDRIAGNLMEGRVAIVVDGSPMVSIVPATMVQFYQSSEDYYERTLFGTAVRIVRLASFVVAVSLTGIYVALVDYHQHLIPSAIVLSIAKNRAGVPFPTIVEALFMELTIELLREASIRLPGSIGQVIGIVGALVIGQAAVQAKLASPLLIIIVAITAISSYVVPQFSTSYSIRFARFPIIFAAAAFGAYGIALVWIMLLLHLCSLESFGQPYLAGIAPFRWQDFKDTFVRAPLWLMGRRAAVPGAEDEDRLTDSKGEEKNEKKK